MGARIDIVCLLIAIAAIPSTVVAQTAQVGQLTGEVVDATGARLPAAAVTLSSEERGFTRTAVTDAAGAFRFPVVPPGRYTVTVSRKDFESLTVAGNLVEAEKTTQVPLALKLASFSDEASAMGEVPIVDATNQTQQTRLRAEEFSKLPVVRTYQGLVGLAPGVVGTGNVNAHGALSSNNLFLFDGVDTTDPTTGTNAANLHFEAIQELVIRTSAVSVDFGRATGAIVDVITKSDSNLWEGGFKYLVTNDRWNAQNTTTSEVAPGASLARTRFNQRAPIYSGTLGGPVRTNRAWFFAGHEYATNTSPQRQTNAASGFSPDDYVQRTSLPYTAARVTTRLAPNHNLWVRYSRSATNGVINDYWPPASAAERFALTNQDQGASQWAAQYTGVVGSRWTAELTVAHATEFITVSPFTVGPTEGGAAFLNQTDNRAYNASAFDGYVRRPRTQATAAMQYFTGVRGRPHALKLGLDWQGVGSQNSFQYPTGSLFTVDAFDQPTCSPGASSRAPAPSRPTSR
jgi:Carboxypeptidase regulatory-like domain